MEQCSQFIAGTPVPYSATNGVRPGFVHVRHRGYELGCGRWKQGQLYCELPKFLRSQL
ncbi:MAG: hypothetical protein F6K30_18985 [Cyanothece sp. SIO2G6]|nr:hypothetical protein [Cyanothece sp. SIO2G6]